MNIKDVGSWLMVMVALTVCSALAINPDTEKEIRLMALTAVVGLLSAGVGYFLRGKVEQNG